MAGGKGDIHMRVRVDGMPAIRDLKKTNRAMMNQMRRMKRQMSKTVGGIGMGLGGLRSSLAIIGGGMAIRGALGPMMDFETAMSNVAAKTQTTRGELGALEKEIRKVAMATKFTAGQTGEAAGFLAMAGMDPAQIKSAIKHTLDLAAATKTSVQQTADIVTNIATPLGLLNDAGLKRTADVLTKVASETNVSLVELGEAMSYAAPEMDLLGLSLEKGAALLGVLGDNALKGGRGGIVFRQMKVALIKTMDDEGKALGKQAAAMRKYGISVKDASGHLKPFDKILHELKDKFEGIHKDDQAKAVLDIFGTRPSTAITNWLKDMDKVDAVIAAAHDSLDEAGIQATKQMDNLEGDLQILKSVFEEVRIAFAKSGIYELSRQIVQAITGFLTRNQEAWALAGHVVTKVLTDIGNAIKNLNKKIPLLKLFGAAIGLAVGAKVVGKIFKFGRSLYSVGRAILSIGKTLTLFMLTNPIGWVIIAVVAAIAIFLKFEKRIKATMAVIGEDIKAGMDYISGLWDGFVDGAKSMFTTANDEVNKWDEATYAAVMAVGGYYQMMDEEVNKWVSKSVNFLSVQFPLLTDIAGDMKEGFLFHIGKITEGFDNFKKDLAASWNWIQDKYNAFKSAVGFGTDAEHAPGSVAGNPALHGNAGGWKYDTDMRVKDKMEEDTEPTILENISGKYDALKTQGAAAMKQALGLDTFIGGGAAGGGAGYHPMHSAAGVGDTAAPMDSPRDGGNPGGITMAGGEGEGLLGRMGSAFGKISSGAVAASDSMERTFAEGLEKTFKKEDDFATKTKAMLKDVALTAIQLGGKTGKFAKKLALVNAVVMGAGAVTRAFSDHPYPWSVAVAGLVAAKTMIEIKSIKSQKVPQAHDGITNVDRPGTYLLGKDERVVSSRVNADLKGFLKGAHDKAMMDKAAVTNNIFLDPDGQYSGSRIMEAFGDEPGYAIEMSQVR